MSKYNSKFTETIIIWYHSNKRDIPWRNTKDPYKIWVSEIILQQTRVSQGLPYYEKFVKAFPTVKDLAQATEEEVLKLWQGLGYYSRARNMHYTARYIVADLKAVFPIDYNELIQLKGVGDYTASAISSFCNNENQPVVDGNVYRVLSRYFGVKTAINTAKAKKEFKELAFKLIDKKNPGLFNQAIMEFGSLQCSPNKPNCSICPLNESCVALQKNIVGSLPTKNKKIKIRKRFFNYVIISTPEKKTIINKRVANGIWKNLYEFPLIETEGIIGFNKLIQNMDFLEIVKETSYSLSLATPKPLVQKLSHQHLYIQFWMLSVDSRLKNEMSWEEVSKRPFPVVIGDFIGVLLANEFGV
jgi:A/G-specific adenine glycosylase